ncbi:hypothetical protein [Desulfovibrio desulfuricans]|uniref:hypothetical protein n=1 Tax=Desulfovibrio desulfuricans TaxID=876 RepID=UPI001AEAA6F1|nr:hypothetical protein [Desulfovibrio desulfuricans]QTO39960.1 hypothetical protein J8J02_12780 [Desulfovibrio desulfuricans]
MARKNSGSNEKPMKTTTEDEEQIVPNVNDLTEDDFKKRGRSQSHKLSRAASSVLKAVKNELKGSGENLNDFISEAIIHYSNARFTSKILGKIVKSHNPMVVQPSEKSRIAALERIIAIIGVEFLENKDEEAFEKMKKFLKSSKNIPNSVDLKEQCEEASGKTGIFTSQEDMPLWLILLYAKKFKFI